MPSIQDTACQLIMISR